MRAQYNREKEKVPALPTLPTPKGMSVGSVGSVGSFVNIAIYTHTRAYIVTKCRKEVPLLPLLPTDFAKCNIQRCYTRQSPWAEGAEGADEK